MVVNSKSAVLNYNHPHRYKYTTLFLIIEKCDGSFRRGDELDQVEGGYLGWNGPQGKVLQWTEPGSRHDLKGWINPDNDNNIIMRKTDLRFYLQNLNNQMLFHLLTLLSAGTTR
jgi:hypothetical protein